MAAKLQGQLGEQLAKLLGPLPEEETRDQQRPGGACGIALNRFGEPDLMASDGCRAGTEKPDSPPRGIPGVCTVSGEKANGEETQTARGENPPTGPGHGRCSASYMITVEGKDVGWMCRVNRKRPRQRLAVLAGQGRRITSIIRQSRNLRRQHDRNYDRSIAPFHAPPGTAYEASRHRSL